MELLVLLVLRNKIALPRRVSPARGWSGPIEPRSQQPHQLAPIRVGRHHVEQDRVGVRDRVEARPPGRGHRDVEPGEPQCALQ
ncbi:hypothetical protein [Saccharothrix sp. Mg75]|uniref:hypothetical protein n=1 Tax=Saccharothrix sp. Mg75 TaxID=3445357 RepID=UPI003EE9F6EA